jgi:hypothetical protein
MDELYEEQFKAKPLPVVKEPYHPLNKPDVVLWKILLALFIIGVILTSFIVLASKGNERGLALKQLMGEKPIFEFNGQLSLGGDPINISIETYQNGTFYDGIIELHGVTKEDLLYLAKKFNG